jgi:hypothetical protein
VHGVLQRREMLRRQAHGQAVEGHNGVAGAVRAAQLSAGATSFACSRCGSCAAARVRCGERRVPALGANSGQPSRAMLHQPSINNTPRILTFGSGV